MEKYSGETARKTSGFEFKERESTREQPIAVNRLTMHVQNASLIVMAAPLHTVIKLCYRNKDDNIPFESSTTIVSTLFFL